MKGVEARTEITGDRNPILRVSDARMSGVSDRVCVLHGAPKSFVGGPSVLLKTDGTIRFDRPNRRLDMLVGDAELAARRAAWIPPEPRFGRGLGGMVSRHISQLDQGCDFEFMQSDFGAFPAEPGNF